MVPRAMCNREQVSVSWLEGAVLVLSSNHALLPMLDRQTEEQMQNRKQRHLLYLTSHFIELS